MKNIFEQLVILTKFMTRIPIPIKVDYFILFEHNFGKIFKK